MNGGMRSEHYNLLINFKLKNKDYS